MQHKTHKAGGITFLPPRTKSTGLIRSGIIGAVLGSLLTAPLVFGFAPTEEETIALIDSRLGYFRQCDSKLITNMLDANCEEYLRSLGIEPASVLDLNPPKHLRDNQQQVIADKISEGKPDV